MKQYTNLVLGLWISVCSLSGVEALCSLCGDRPIPNDGLLHEKNGISCRSLFEELTYMEGGTQECDRIQLAAFQTGCCDEQYVPQDVCSVCPDGSPFRTSVSIPGSPERRELTCADIATEGSFLDFFTTPGDCSDTFLQRSAAWCQCPGHEIECHLCPKGAAPTNLDKTENVLYGWDCRSFQYVTALLNQGECSVAPKILDFDATAFCCEGVEPPNLCDFCPEGEEIVNPAKTIATQYGFVKCGDIEESLRMIPTVGSCQFVKQALNPGMCCGIPGASKAIRTELSLMSAAILLLSSIYAIA